MIELKFFLSVILLGFQKIEACVSSFDSPVENIESGGLQREYLLHVPTSYTGEIAVPFILAFHGRSEDACNQEDISRLSEISFNPDAIVAYPQGWPNRKGIQQWQGDPDAPADIDDIGFTLDIIKQVSSTFKISSSEIYATGKSNGGGLVGLLACNVTASSQIAAFAPVSGAYYLENDGSLPPCDPSSRTVPFMEFHGWQDNVIKYEGGEDTRGAGQTPPVPEWIDSWATLDGCLPSQNHTRQLCSTDRSVTRYAWDCNGVADAVVHYNISTIKHNWPSTTPNIDGPYTTCFNATTVIMEFFSKHKLSSVRTVVEQAVFSK